MESRSLNKNQAVIYDAIAKRYGVLPSELLKLELDDIAFNYLVIIEGTKEENKQKEK